MRGLDAARPAGRLGRKRRVPSVIAKSPGARWLIGAPIVHLDRTGADTIAVLADELAAREIRLVMADVHARVWRMPDRSGAPKRLGAGAVFPTLRSAMEAYQSRERPAFALSETSP
jgi:sulfate permease, SulP family